MPSKKLTLDDFPELTACLAVTLQCLSEHMAAARDAFGKPPEYYKEFARYFQENKDAT